MPQSTIDRRVRRAATEAANALDAADSNGWRVAELTHRNTRGGGRPGNVATGSVVSLAEWVTAVNRDQFNRDTASIYRRTWTKYGERRLRDSNGAERSFGDHLFAVRHPDLIHLLDEAEAAGVSAARLRIREQEAEADLGDRIDTQGAEPVIDSLTDDQVEELTEAAHRRRPRAAQAGAGRAARTRIPAPPGGGGLVDAPGSQDTLWMDADREIGNMHSATTALHRLHALDPEMMRQRADRLAREAELVRMLAEVCQGVDPNELERAMATWAGE